MDISLSIGEISTIQAKKLYTEILSYFDRLPMAPINDPIYDKVRNSTLKPFKKTFVRPLPITQVIKHTPTLEECVTRDDKKNFQIRRAIYCLKMGIYRTFPIPTKPCARALVRGKREPEIFKLIWSYPEAMTIAERMFAQPLIEAFKTLENNPYGLWIFNNVKNNLSELRNRRKSPNNLWFSVEWLPFSHRTPAWLIRDCFEVLRSCMDFKRYEERGDSLKMVTILWNQIIHYFINTPIELPNGGVLKKMQGIPRGSHFANIVESLANFMCTQYCLRQMKVPYAKRSQWYYGYQGLVLVRSPIDLEKFKEIALETFGFQLDTTKTRLGKDASFLGYNIPTVGPVELIDEKKILAELNLPNLAHEPLLDILPKSIELELFMLGSDYRAENNRRARLDDFPPMLDIMLKRT